MCGITYRLSRCSPAHGAPPGGPLQLHDVMLLLWAEVQDGQDGVERLQPPAAVLQRQELVDDVLQVLQVGALSVLVPDQLVEAVPQLRHLLLVPFRVGDQPALQLVQILLQATFLPPQAARLHLLTRQLLGVQQQRGLSGRGLPQRLAYHVTCAVGQKTAKVLR